MLSKKYRLCREEIESLKSKKSPILQGELFGLIFQKDDSNSKFALIISNKVAKKSTERNRIKRLFFQEIRKVLFEEKGKFLFLAKKRIITATQKDIGEDLFFIKEKIASF